MSEFVIDLSIFEELAGATPFESFWFVFTHGGWAIILWGFLWGLWTYWNFYILNAYQDSVKFILLAIDVPKNNETGPLAVENIFSQLAGTHGTETLYQRYWQGKSQLSYSFEIVSIDGYVQFIVRMPEIWRDIVEASIYAQYPDAEITEIEDYVRNVPQRWPHPEYEFFGLEYKLHKPECYPIRTWLEFEDKLEGVFKDPMAALLEIMSKIGPGEQVWIQFILTPIDDSWKEGGEKVVNKLIEREEKHAETVFGKILSIPFFFLTFAMGFVYDILFASGEEGHKEEKKKKDFPTMMMHMTPGEKDVVAAIQHKISKIGYRTKFRIMYIAKKEVYHLQRGGHAVVGATKQFNSVELNRFALQKKIWTRVYYVFTKYRLKERQNKLMRAYRVRSDARGAGRGFVLNIEELASLWHFPVMQVKAPLVKKTESKRAEPPFALPTRRDRAPRIKQEQHIQPLSEIGVQEQTIEEVVATKEPPPNLPIV